MLKNIGPSTVPSGTPLITACQLEYASQTFTLGILPRKQSSNGPQALLLKPYADSLASNSACGIVSNAFDRSIDTTATSSFLSRQAFQSSVNLSKVSQLWCHLYADI